MVNVLLRAGADANLLGGVSCLVCDIMEDLFVSVVKPLYWTNSLFRLSEFNTKYFIFISTFCIIGVYRMDIRSSTGLLPLDIWGWLMRYYGLTLM